MKKIDNVINEILSDDDLPEIETVAARKAKFIKEIADRVNSKKGFLKTIEAIKCIPLAIRYGKNEAHKI